MSRFSGVQDWMAVALAAGLAFVTWWLVFSHGFGDNVARAGSYTICMFTLLAIALQPAWRRLRLWFDLLILLALHVVLILPLVNFLDAHSIRLNWIVALPFLSLEALLFLGVLWKRNVRDSSRPHV